MEKCSEHNATSSETKRSKSGWLVGCLTTWLDAWLLGLLVDWLVTSTPFNST